MSIQIQGSARVRLEDGTMVRINYDAHNGHSYMAVGRILIERNLIPREEMSMDRISHWMAKIPDQAKEARGTNKSFVFFRITGLNNDRNRPARRACHSRRAARSRSTDPRLRHAVLHRGGAAARRPAPRIGSAA